MTRLEFTWGTPCGVGVANEWCVDNRDPHKHGFACDKRCPCRTDQAAWRRNENDRKA